MQNKICLCLLTTSLCKEVLERFDYIRRGVDYMDFYILCDSSNCNDIVEGREDIIKFDGKELWSHYNSFDKRKPYVGNAQFVLAEFSKTHDYEYYWLCEDDIFMPNGSYVDFFNKCKEIDCDLLLTSRTVDTKKDIIEKNNTWYWYRFIRRKEKYLYHTWVQFFRLSKNGINAILKDFNSFDRAHTESAIPSIIYNNGLRIKYMFAETDYKFVIDWRKLKSIDNEINTFYHPMKIVNKNQQSLSSQDTCQVHSYRKSRSRIQGHHFC